MVLVFSMFISGLDFLNSLYWVGSIYWTWKTYIFRYLFARVVFVELWLRFRLPDISVVLLILFGTGSLPAKIWRSCERYKGCRNIMYHCQLSSHRVLLGVWILPFEPRDSNHIVVVQFDGEILLGCWQKGSISISVSIPLLLVNSWCWLWIDSQALLGQVFASL